LSEISRGLGSGGGAYFSTIEKGRGRKKQTRSSYKSDTNLKEPGRGLLGEGHYISVTPFTISTYPSPLANL